MKNKNLDKIIKKTKTNHDKQVELDFFCAKIVHHMFVVAVNCTPFILLY